ncbi:MAG: hypothetical protein AAGI54_12010 [Planctomycetota bacterium]
MSFFNATQRKTGLGTFGGPIDRQIKNVDRSAQLHNTLRFALPSAGISDLPLIYGFQHDGCRIAYEVESQAIVIKEIDPPHADRSNEWPYPNYPHEFAEKQLTFEGSEPSSFDQFIELTYLGRAVRGDSTWHHVIIRPHESLGVSLWGEREYEDYPLVVFNINPKTRYVCAYSMI